MANISGSNVPGTTLFPIITLLVVGHDQQGCYASAYKMAVSETNLLYGDRLRFELSTIVRPDFLSCATAAANVVDVVTAFYYRGDYPSSQKPLISVFPSCVPVVSEMGPIMAEWNHLFITASGSGEALRNKEKYPTVVSTAPTDNSGFTSFFKAILLTFSWKTVFLLCDTNDEVTSFYVATCGSVKRLLKGSIPPFSLHDGTFNSALVREPDLAGLLRMTSSRARVLFLFGNSASTRQFMVEAHKLNMTSGDHVYFFPQPFKSEEIFPELTWKLHRSDDDVSAAESFYLLSRQNPVDTTPSLRLGRTTSISECVLHSGRNAV
ncbi:hypothetical protein RvY_16907-1 [Ramazzottius varieornatus]|uniref:Receptor ligand binding region domain-containing protein n=1 Tax=Ramazzottius varieornatus TaxID=947166 RepID=A0A1D1W065_RAMVA|nr:hypothetical protein RvY_16907-1 [Ramazzottius varieornatus]